MSAEPVPHSSADDPRPVHAAPDAHGQAALLLVESLIHGLIARSSMTVAEAIEVIEIATEIKIEMTEERRAPLVVGQRSLTLLHAMAASLTNDRPA